MTPEGNQRFMRHLVDETINRKNLDAIDKSVVPNFIEHVPLPGQGPEHIAPGSWEFHRLDGDDHRHYSYRELSDKEIDRGAGFRGNPKQERGVSQGWGHRGRKSRMDGMH